jgi:hypothetical protein
MYINGRNVANNPSQSNLGVLELCGNTVENTANIYIAVRPKKNIPLAQIIAISTLVSEMKSVMLIAQSVRENIKLRNEKLVLSRRLLIRNAPRKRLEIINKL